MFIILFYCSLDIWTQGCSEWLISPSLSAHYQSQWPSPLESSSLVVHVKKANRFRHDLVCLLEVRELLVNSLQFKIPMEILSGYAISLFEWHNSISVIEQWLCSISPNRHEDINRCLPINQYTFCYLLPSSFHLRRTSGVIQRYFTWFVYWMILPFR